MPIDACHCEPAPLEIVIANQRRNAGVAIPRYFRELPDSAHWCGNPPVLPRTTGQRTLVWPLPGISSGHNLPVLPGTTEKTMSLRAGGRIEIVIANQRRNAGVAIPRFFRELPDSAHWCGPFQGFPPVTISWFSRALPVTVSLRTSPQTGVAIPRYFREPPKEQRL